MNVLTMRSVDSEFVNCRFMDESMLLCRSIAILEQHTRANGTSEQDGKWYLKCLSLLTEWYTLEMYRLWGEARHAFFTWYLHDFHGTRAFKQMDAEYWAFTLCWWFMVCVVRFLSNPIDQRWSSGFESALFVTWIMYFLHLCHQTNYTSFSRPVFSSYERLSFMNDNDMPGFLVRWWLVILQNMKAIEQFFTVYACCL